MLDTFFFHLDTFLFHLDTFFFHLQYFNQNTRILPEYYLALVQGKLHLIAYKIDEVNVLIKYFMIYLK